MSSLQFACEEGNACLHGRALLNILAFGSESATSPACPFAIFRVFGSGAITRDWRLEAALKPQTSSCASTLCACVAGDSHWNFQVDSYKMFKVGRSSIWLGGQDCVDQCLHYRHLGDGAASDICLFFL